MKNKETKTEILNELLVKLEKTNFLLRRRTSFRYLFAYSVVQGIGYALGATIIASIVAALLIRAVGTLDYVPILNEVFNAEQIRETIQPDSLQR